MDWLFEVSRDCGRRFPWISIPGVASNCLLVAVGYKRRKKEAETKQIKLNISFANGPTTAMLWARFFVIGNHPKKIPGM